MMEKTVLKDHDQYPSKDVIFSTIGDKKLLWTKFFEYIHTRHPGFSEEWRYYKDGHNWLMKVTLKTKTIFWLSLIENGFRITFYFSDKAEEAILDSEVSDELKKQFKEGKHYGKIRGLTIPFTDELAIDYAKILIAIRLKK